MPPTQQEIALRASRISAERARTRRFKRYVDEIEEHPAALAYEDEERLAYLLRAKGWIAVLSA